MKLVSGGVEPLIDFFLRQNALSDIMSGDVDGLLRGASLAAKQCQDNPNVGDISRHTLIHH